MTTKLKSTNTHQADEAVETLKLFHDPLNFTISGMQRTLLKTLNDAAMSPDSCTLDDEDYYNFYHLTEILDAVEQWQNKYADKGKMLDELYKAGISLTQLDEFFIYADNCLQRRQDYAPKKDFLLKLWTLLSDHQAKK